MRIANTIFGSVEYRKGPVRGGGFCTGMDVPALDGTVVVRTDTNGAFVRSPGDAEWTPLLRFGDNVDETYGKYNYPNQGRSGGYDVAIAATNSSVIYAVCMGRVWKTTDKGLTLAPTSLPYSTNYDANDSNRTYRRKLLIDPAGTSTVLFFDPSPSTGGLQATTDGGDTWAKNAQIPASVGLAAGCIAVDRNSGTTSGKTNKVYVSNGAGLYRSTDTATGTFSQMTGTNAPTSGISSIVAFGNGIVLVADGTGIKRFDGASWSQVVTSTEIGGVTVNYADTTKVLGLCHDGKYMASTDSGQTWTTKGGILNRVAADIPWLATTREDWMSAGGMEFDPLDGGLWLAEGIGVWKTFAPVFTPNPTVTWNSRTLGIDQLCMMDMKVTPSGRLLTAQMDRTFARLNPSQKTNPQHIGTHYGPPNTMITVTAIDHGTGIDFAADDENYVVGVSTANNKCSISTDGASNFDPAPSLPANITGGIYGGSVVVGNTGNIVWLPTNGSGKEAYPSYSLDGAETWAECRFNGVLLSSLATAPKIHTSESLRRCPLVCDKTNGDIYLYIWGHDFDSTVDATWAGVWKSTDHGENFARVYASHINDVGKDGWNGKLKAVPGKTGHLIWCFGDDATDDVANTPGGLKISLDGGESWISIPGLLEPEDFCLTAGLPGSSYPTIKAYGYSAMNDKTTRGVYQCVTFNPANIAGTTWLKESDAYVLGNIVPNIVMAGHPDDEFGRFHLGTGGGGLITGEYRDGPIHFT